MKQDIHSLIYRIVGIGVKQGVNILIFFIAAKILTPHEFGTYNYIFAFALALATFGDFGISTATAKYVAKQSALKAEIRSSVVGSATSVVFGMSSLLTIILWLGHSFFKVESTYLWALSFIIYAVPLFAVFDGIYRGQHDNKALAKAASLGAIFALSGSFLLIENFGVRGALISQALFYAIGILVFILRFKDPFWAVKKEVTRDILRISVPLGLIALAYLAYARVDAILLGLWGYTTEVGYYEMANKIILLLSLPIQIFAQVETPRMVGLWHTARASLYPLARKYFFASIPFFVLLSVGTYIFIPTVLNIFFAEYVNEIFYIMFGSLLLAYVFQATADLIGNIFTVATDHEKLNLYVLVSFGVINLLLVYLGIKYFGPIGVAYAKIAVSIPYTMVFLSLYFRRLRRITPAVDINAAEPFS